MAGAPGVAGPVCDGVGLGVSNGEAPGVEACAGSGPCKQQWGSSRGACCLSEEGIDGHGCCRGLIAVGDSINYFIYPTEGARIWPHPDHQNDHGHDHDHHIQAEDPGL